MSESTNNERMCLLDGSKVCDDCGECDRCDLDPNKICDNCCKCLAIEDENEDFRTVTIDGEHSYKHQRNAAVKGENKNKSDKKPGSASAGDYDAEGAEEPHELTPELVAYWENKLVELGEAPADDGLGEIAVSSRVPVKGVRKRKGKHRTGIRMNE